MIDGDKKEYYNEMVRRGRAIMYFSDENKLLGIVTFLVGSDDDKYLLQRDPWTVIQDDPAGDTVYVDQLITVGGEHKNVRRELKKAIEEWKTKFPNIKQVKWTRVSAKFRKHGITEGVRNGIFKYTV